MISVLLSGTGRFIDYVKCFAYSLTPLIICIPVRIAFSYYAILSEEAFYNVLLYLPVCISVFMVFTFYCILFDAPFRAIVAIILTCIAVAVLLFVLLIFFSLLQQIISFAVSVFTELQTRGL